MRTDIAIDPVPARALGLSTLALGVPVIGALVVPEQVGEYRALLWLTALVPAFLLAYHRGWRGVATALAAGMATLSVTEGIALAQGRSFPDLLLGVVVAYVTLSLGIGWLADALHADRAAVEDMAFTDLLTRLPNRRHARFFLENEFAAAERGRDLSVVVFDLDNFKDYNDRFGHPAGDQALETFADILRQSTRRMDLSGRFGGEEFVTVLAGSETEGAIAFADRVRLTLANTTLHTSARLTVSAGVATYHASMRSPDELIAAADSALYEAKREGRNRVRRFDPESFESVKPSADAGDPVLPGTGMRPIPEYPREAEDIGRVPPPLTLLPHQLTGFGTGRSVLLVEDDEAVRRMVGNYLAREEFSVDTAVDVPDALSRLGREYDVIVADLRLPGPFGTELIRVSKARWPGTRVVVITGLTDPAVLADALAAGADRYLLKPFGMPDLRKVVLEALGMRAQGTILRMPDPTIAALDDGADAELRGALAHLGEAVLVRHPFLRGHAELAAALAAPLAAELGLPVEPERLADLCGYALLGNLTVPVAILGRTGPLGPEDWVSVQRHPIVGKELLRHLTGDQELLAAVRWHHERWDGAGYPDALSGSSIPLAARIVGAAEALAAMLSPRPHRDALAWDAALAEIEAGAGGQFDPDTAEAVRGRAVELERAWLESGAHAAD